MQYRENYVPILKWKAGEQTALNQLSTTQKNHIFPLVEIVTLDSTNSIIRQIKKCFPHPLYVDIFIADEDDDKFLINLINVANKEELEIIPVLYYYDFPTTADEIIKIINKIVVRIAIPEDLEGPSYQEIFDTITKFKNKNPNIIIDLILDLGVIDKKNNANTQFSELKNVCLPKILPISNVLRKIIISSTSFPEDISQVRSGENVLFNRFDFKIFKKLISEATFSKLKPQLIYSDYGVTKFTDSEIDFSKLRYGILPKVKYTSFDDYIVLKGARDKSRNLVRGYYELAHEIYSSSYYYKSHFSYGDAEIEKRALRKTGPGNSKDWVAFTANHHIAVVIEQLSTLP